MWSFFSFLLPLPRRLGIWSFPGPVSNLSHSHDLSHTCGNDRSLNPLFQARDQTCVPPTPRHHWSPLHHNRNSSIIFCCWYSKQTFLIMLFLMVATLHYKVHSCVLPHLILSPHIWDKCVIPVLKTKKGHRASRNHDGGSDVRKPRLKSWFYHVLFVSFDELFNPSRLCFLFCKVMVIIS